MGSFVLLALGLLLLLLLLDPAAAAGRGTGRGDKAQVAQFIFGDSLVDSGNNDYLLSLAKANFYPNGIDTQTRAATGRFCNGLLIADFISQFLGSKPVLPFLDPTARPEDLLRGSNFASAGAGILADTGSIFVRRMTMQEQLGLFQRYQQRLASLVGPKRAPRLVAKALVSVTIGGNDYINNYLLPLSPRRAQYSSTQFNALLVSTLQSQLQQLYNLGARRIAVSNMGPVGCIPSQKSTKSPSGACVAELQQNAIHFNSLLKPMLDQMSQRFRDATFLYTDAFTMMMGIINNAGSYGLTNVKDACCGQGALNGNGICTVASNLCSNREVFLWWDPYHPTEKVNRIIAERLLNGPPSDISPMNLKQLLKH